MTGNPDLVKYYSQLHNSQKYGDTSVRYFRHILPDIKLLKPKSILDYGCGQSKLLDIINYRYPVECFRYDPAIESFSELPKNKVDLILNIDVLEHIENNDLDTIIEEIASASHHAIIIIDTKPATRTLPDGRNVHVSLHPPEWWLHKLSQHFSYIEYAYNTGKSRVSFRTWKHNSLDKIYYNLSKTLENIKFHYNKTTNIK